MDKTTAKKIYSKLKKEYPEAKCALVHKNAFQLLVATILSAQCTDARVNMVTPELFKKYKTIRSVAEAQQGDMEDAIRSTGFYRNKAKNIIASAKMILKDFGGEVPDEMEDLVKLPGVARKTANIVLYHVFGKNEGVAVDTHVKRISGKLGFTRHTDPKKIEPDLMELFPQTEWGRLTDVIILHGRAICIARRPKCAECVVNDMCPSREA